LSIIQNQLLQFSAADRAELNPARIVYAFALIDKLKTVITDRLPDVERIVFVTAGKSAPNA